jgi:hypothetical protein
MIEDLLTPPPDHLGERVEFGDVGLSHELELEIQR